MINLWSRTCNGYLTDGAALRETFSKLVLFSVYSEAWGTRIPSPEVTVRGRELGQKCLCLLQFMLTLNRLLCNTAYRIIIYFLILKWAEKFELLYLEGWDIPSSNFSHLDSYGESNVLTKFYFEIYIFDIFSPVAKSSKKV